MRRLLAPLTLFLLLLFVVIQSARAAVPPAPEFGVLDEVDAFSLPIRKATERVLSEHRRLTNESVFVAVVKSVPEGQLGARAREILDVWRMETPVPPNTVLLLVDAEHGELGIRAGLGLDPVVTEAEIKDVAKIYFRPEWRAGKPTRALTFSVVEVLRALESPLITNGEAVDIYDRAGHVGSWTPISVRDAGRSWWIWILSGGAVIGLAFYFALSVEAHYTALGWTRVAPWRALAHRMSRPNKKRGEGLITGGGVSGSY